MSKQEKYFCSEPWVGVLSIEMDLQAVFCPCYLKMKLGSVRDHSLDELWNAPALRELRESFARGELPALCRPQLCPVALGENSQKLG